MNWKRSSAVDRSLSTVWLLSLFVDTLSFWQHALMQDARYQDSPGFTPVENNMSPVFHATQAGPDLITGAAQLWIIPELLAARFKSLDIADRLIFSPFIQRVSADVHQVRLGKAGETEFSHSRSVPWARSVRTWLSELQLQEQCSSSFS